MQSPISFHGWMHKLQKSKLGVLSDLLTDARYHFDYFCTAEQGRMPWYREESGLSKHSLSACELLLFLALLLFLILSIRNIANTVIWKYCNSRVFLCTNSLGFISSISPPGLCGSCGCCRSPAAQGEGEGGGGQDMRRSITPLCCSEARRKLDYETVLGPRAPLDVQLCREWQIMVQVVLMYYLNYNSEKYWYERPHPCYTCCLPQLETCLKLCTTDRFVMKSRLLCRGW